MNKKTLKPTSPSRRGFLRGAAAAVPILAVPSWASHAVQSTETGTDTLTALAEVALPSDTLGPAATSSVLRRFNRWSENFQPVAELDHPYLSTDIIPYGPPDPRPLWASQLEALELESQHRHALSFAEVSKVERQAILERQLPRNAAGRLPHASEAPHVAIALMAWFYSTTEANDLCHGAAIGRHTCRGLPDARAEPSALVSLPDWDEERQ